MAPAAIAYGRHVRCEKPLASSVAAARIMTDAAREGSVVTQMGFNYLCNPMIRLARENIEAGGWP